MNKMLELAKRLAKAPDAEAFGLFAYNGRDLIDAALRQCSAESEPKAWRYFDTKSPEPKWHVTDVEPANDGSYIVQPLAPLAATEPQTAPTCQCNNPLVMMKDGREHCGKCGRPAAQCQAESEK
jgi:hypothetical protein